MNLLEEDFTQQLELTLCAVVGNARIAPTPKSLIHFGTRGLRISARFCAWSKCPIALLRAMDTDAEVSDVEQVSTPDATDQVDSAALRDDEVAEDEVPERPNSPEEEEKAIQKLIDIGDLEMAEGDTYFLIASR